ncbi:hypothetical protein B0H13DRAFT_2326623 [Mycena leptocephala]|nr:hypothetical protein B0H13DRAFT_2326623 [Mycena leptocephala]
MPVVAGAVAVAQPPPAPAPAAGPSPTELFMLLIAQKLTNTTRNLAPIPAPATPAAAVPTNIPVSSPTVALRRHVSVHEFCERCSISPSEECEFLELDFLPGDQQGGLGGCRIQEAWMASSSTRTKHF